MALSFNSSKLVRDLSSGKSGRGATIDNLAEQLARALHLEGSILIPHHPEERSVPGRYGARIQTNFGQPPESIVAFGIYAQYAPQGIDYNRITLQVRSSYFNSGVEQVLDGIIKKSDLIDKAAT